MGLCVGGQQKNQTEPKRRIVACELLTPFSFYGGKMKYDKTKRLKTILDSAKIYDKILRDKELLIIAKQGKMLVSYQIRFRSYHFEHFTGVESKLNANDFFQRALHNKLSVNDFKFKDDFLAEKKLRVLEHALKLPYTARMIGEFNYAGIKIQADIGSGSNSFTMAFRKDNKGVLYPVSVLEEDIRKSIRAASPIIVILSRNVGEKMYQEITYRSKNVNFDKIHISKEIQDTIQPNILKLLQHSETCICDREK